MDAFEIVSPALASSQRSSLEDLFAAVRPDAAIRSPRVRHVLYFGALPLKFVLQGKQREFQELRRLSQKRLLKKGGVTVRFDRFLGFPTYASIAWQLEQIFAKADEAERAGKAALARDLNDEAAYFLSCLLSCMTSLPALLNRAARELVDSEARERCSTPVNANIFADMWDLNPLWLDHHALNLRGPEDQIEAFYSVAIMTLRGFFEAVSSAIGCGENADAASKRYGMGKDALNSVLESIEMQFAGIDEVCMAYQLGLLYRDFEGMDLVRSLRLFFVTPFAALYESGALRLVRPKEQTDFVTADVCAGSENGQLDALLRAARERLAGQQTAA